LLLDLRGAVDQLRLDRRRRPLLEIELADDAAF
jgi:hypothetical protein